MSRRAPGWIALAIVALFALVIASQAIMLGFASR